MYRVEINMMGIRAVASVGPGGARPPLIKSWPPPPVGLGRYIESFLNKKFSNRNTLVHIKYSLASGGFAPGFLYIYIYIHRYVTTIYIYIYYIHRYVTTLKQV